MTDASEATGSAGEAPEREADLDALARRYSRPPEAHHRDRRSKLLSVVYADPGNHDFYYRERMPDSVAAFVRVDIVAAALDAERAARLKAEERARVAEAVVARFIEAEKALNSARSILGRNGSFAAQRRRDEAMMALAALRSASGDAPPQDPSPEALLAEWHRLDRLWHSDDIEGGGSPREGIETRTERLEDEMRRRGLPIPESEVKHG